MTAETTDLEVLRGDTVVLRPLRIDDAPDIVVGCDDPLSQRFLQQLPSPYTLADARWWITEGAPASRATGGQVYGIADPASDRLIGCVGLSRRGRHEMEVGYWVVPGVRGRGVATEATRLLSTHALTGDVARLELRTDPANAGSQRVAIAAGFTREGIARGAGSARDGSRYDLIVWARLATDSGEPTSRVIPDLPGGELTDGMVTLRPVTAEDAEDMYALRNLPECIARSVPPEPVTREEVERRCAHTWAHWLAGSRADLTIRDAATDAFAGDIGLFNPDRVTRQAMVGYSMVREWRGRGYVTRAVNLLTEWAFTDVGMERVIAGTAPDNTASQHVLSRAGFEREAYLRALLPGPDDTRIDDIQWVRFRPPLPSARG